MGSHYTYKKYSTNDHLIYNQSLQLRNELLRISIGKSIYSENLVVEKDNDFYGTFEGKQLIGTLSYYEEELYVADLTAFAVKPIYQRNGIGQKLVEELRQALKSKDYKEIRLDAREEAVRFYKKCNFDIVSGPLVNESLNVIDFKMVCRI